ncbi:MAG: cation-translocating P-type ATPase [Sphingobacteriia bacterium]|nr:cation-translocating P-type ATPase [Sphingobacteriia bacterium]NCC40321.1 cation-translocating P-type ATPase [Gammaproteobacteria bacterium]
MPGSPPLTPADRAVPERAWHGLSVRETAAALGVNPRTGLSAAAAAARLARHGENRLGERRPRSLGLRLLDQFRGDLVIVLLGAAVLAGAIGDLTDALVILVVVVLNALLGFYQEARAERTLAALAGMLAPRARVRRDGETREIAAAGLVPGDLVLLQAGDRVPADGRLIAAHGLEVDEAALTGESQAVGKSTETLTDADRPLGDRFDMLYMNTVVTRGRAELLVTATGMRTETGRLAGLIAATPAARTPLQRQLDVLGQRLALIAGAVVLVILGLSLARHAPLVEAVMMAVALAVAAIPEGLPAVVTVTLAIGMWRMARNRAILKQLAAVETLGATTVICSDKTGTLTLNQMTARAGWFAGHAFSVSGQGYAPVGTIAHAPDAPDLRPYLLPMVLCTDSRVQDGELLGDPTEGALEVLARKGGLDPLAEQARAPRLAEIPFDSAHKLMATVHAEAAGMVIYLKGAPDVLLARARTWLATDGREAPLDEATRQTLAAAHQGLADQALRVLAVARRRIPAADFDPAGDLWQWTHDLTLLGLAGLMDPPRPEAAAAIAQCRAAGIQVKMITGDHRLTAAAVARELGLEGEVVTGEMLEAMSARALARRIAAIAVFARVTPQHKVTIVKALQDRGAVVAMTGDGVNDAPALKAADIGVAMGITGTAVTREAATLVLTDDDFATIVRAVEEGRVIYDNIVKFVRFQLSTNIGAILTVLAATLMALPAPFTPIQLLWINIIMDGPPAMTLGVEPARPGLMAEPPRPPRAQILSARRLLPLVLFGLLMTIGTLGMFLHGLAHADPVTAVTLAFTTFVLFQFFNLFNVRAEHGSAFNANFRRNASLWLALLGVLLLQVAVVHWPPAQAILGTTALSLADWLLATAVASSVLLVEELRKLIRGWVRARVGSGRALP